MRRPYRALGPLLDSCVLNRAAAKAIRNRRQLIATEILSLYQSAAKEFHVASLACGPASEIFDVFEQVDNKGRLHVSCVDVDREALRRSMPAAKSATSPTKCVRFRPT